MYSPLFQIPVGAFTRYFASEMDDSREGYVNEMLCENMSMRNDSNA